MLSDCEDYCYSNRKLEIEVRIRASKFIVKAIFEGGVPIRHKVGLILCTLNPKGIRRNENDLNFAAAPTSFSYKLRFQIVVENMLLVFRFCSGI